MESVISEYKLPQTNTAKINTESQGQQIPANNHTHSFQLVIVVYHKLRIYWLQSSIIIDWAHLTPYTSYMSTA